LADILPYYAISDNISAFLNAGIGMTAPSSGDAEVGWYVNPYLRVGAEWGPSFYVGFQLGNGTDGDTISWKIPVALMVSF